MRRMGGTCVQPVVGQPRTSAPRGSVGSGHAESPTRCPDDDPAQLIDAHRSPNNAVCHRFSSPRLQPDRGRFEELRELCKASGDKVSLAIGMTGQASELNYSGRCVEASRLASEQMALLESIGDPNLTVGLTFVPFINWYDAASSATSCGGRRLSSNSPTATLPKVRASVSGRPWHSRWRSAALPTGGWAVPGGGRTSAKLSRWREPATRQLWRWSPAGATRGSSSGYFEPTTQRFRHAKKPCSVRKRKAAISRCFSRSMSWAPCSCTETTPRTVLADLS